MALGLLTAIHERGLFYSALKVVRSRVKRCKPLRMDILSAIDTLPLPNAIKSALALGLEPRREHPWYACRLHSAVALGQQDAILEALHTGVDANVVVRGATPLVTAVRNARREDRSVADGVHVTKKLLALLTSKGAKVNACSEFGDTALQAAAQSGQVHVMEWLVQNGAEVNARNCKGQSPAELAALAGSFKAVLALMKHGAQVAQTASSGLPILHVAAGAGNVWVKRCHGAGEREEEGRW